jgi:hypothetical protein
MKEITNITSDAKQKFDIVLDDNSILELTIEFMDSQQGWKYSFTRNDFIVNDRRLVVGVNLLRTFKNIIPFGMAVSSVDNLDPSFIDDFTAERVKIFILNENDLAYLDSSIYVS